MKKTILLTVATIILTALSAVGQLTARKAFTEAPAKIIPLLDRNTRLDMLDYFDAGIERASDNALKGKSQINSLSDNAISVKITDASTIDIIILPAGSDSLIAVINTVATPAPDSKLTVYSRNWESNLTPSTFAKPALKDWLSAEGRKNSNEVESLVPFLLIGYSYNPSTATLTLTNNTASFLSPDIYTMVEPFLLPELKYNWNGRKFNPAK